MLHDRADVHLVAITERVDVELDRVLDETVDQNGSADGFHRGLCELLVVVADAHRRPPRTYEGRTSTGKPISTLPHVLPSRRRPSPRWAANAWLLRERPEALAVLGKVDRCVRRAEDAVARLLDVAGEAERRLAAELRHHADGLLAVADGEDLLRRERPKYSRSEGVVVRRDGLGLQRLITAS